ncbi:putative glucose dehydrogenase [Coniochaeta sp. 2T2.1]|nr:putative glucose dehydrogenase [Coniochaeta sp. 2T2.1]
MTDTETAAESDYIVVGGGLTGCAMASLLSKSPQKPSVTLIEAGPDASSNPAVAGLLSGLSLLSGELDYGYKSEPDPNTANRVHTLVAGKALGGGSILNFGGWSYEGLMPYFQKTEQFHGTDEDATLGDRGIKGPMHIYPVSASQSGKRSYLLREPINEAHLSSNIPLNLHKPHGNISGLSEFPENTTPSGLRLPSYGAYPLDAVTVLTSTPVHKVLFSTSKKATGVLLASGRTLTARKEIILCAGAYRTPQLLMLSGIGPPDVLSQHSISLIHPLPHVGANLHDHFAVYFAFKLRDPSAGYAFGTQHPAWTPSTMSHLPWDWISTLPVPVHLLSQHTHIPPTRQMYEILTLYLPPGIPGIPIDGTHIATSTMLLRPTSRGTVSISSASPLQPPVIKTNYLSTPLDLQTLLHAARQTLLIHLSPSSPLSPIIASETPPSNPVPLTPLTPTSTDKEIEDRIRQTGAQHHHSGGTAAMGTVTDAEGRVYGVEGLRVADASLVPLPLGGHPQASLYAVVERVAGMVWGV